MEAFQRAFELLRSGDENGLRDLLDQQPALADARDGGSVSLLMHCIYTGRRDLAEQISARRTNLDIFEAASLGRLDRLRQLIADPAAVGSRSPDGFTALHFACFFGQSAAARLLIESRAAVDAIAANPMKVMPLHSAASARNLEAARHLLEHGAPVNARQQAGWAPIHAAAQNGDRPMVELLLKHRADPALRNDAGMTPAAVARQKGHEEIALLLEQATAA